MAEMLRTLFVLLLALALPATAARAADDARHLRYEVFWGGLHAAEFVLSLGGQGETYNHAFHMRSSGVAGWLLRLDITARSQGRYRAAGQPRPEAYRTDFANRWRNGLIDIHYQPRPGDDAEFATVKEWTDPPRREDDEDQADVVSDDATAGTLDPLAAFAEAVRLAGQRSAAGQGDFRIKVFDGRRRFDIVGTALPPGSLKVLGERRDVQRLRLHTEPIAGFNGRQRTLWSEREFEVSLVPSATGGAPIPVRIEADGLGPVIDLTGACTSFEACALPAKARDDPPAQDARAG